MDTGYFSVPQGISWITANNETAHGYYYPPQVRIKCWLDYDKLRRLTFWEIENVLKTAEYF